PVDDEIRRLEEQARRTAGNHGQPPARQLAGQLRRYLEWNDLRVGTVEDKGGTADLRRIGRDVDSRGRFEGGPGDLRRGRRPEHVGSEAALVAFRPAEPGMRHGFDEGVPVALDEAEQRANRGGLHRHTVAGGAAEEDQPADTLWVASGPRDRMWRRSVEAEQDHRVDLSRVDDCVDVAEVRLE